MKKQQIDKAILQIHRIQDALCYGQDFRLGKANLVTKVVAHAVWLRF